MKTVETTDTATPTDADVLILTRARNALLSVGKALVALPDEGDEPKPNERERISVRRRTLIAQRGHLHLLIGRVESLPKDSTEPLKLWKNLLVSAKADFESEFNAMSAHERTGSRRAMELQASVRTIDTGPEVFPSGELMPEPLRLFLESHGQACIGGRWFRSRSGLKDIDGQISALDTTRHNTVGELTRFLSELDA